MFSSRRIAQLAIFLALGATCMSAAPTLKRSYGVEGMNGSVSTEKADDFHLFLDVSPAVTVIAGNELIVVYYRIPKADSVTITDDKSNTWTDIFTTTCEDTNYKYSAAWTVAAAGTSNIKLHTGVSGGVADIEYSASVWYGTATSAAVDVHSCLTGVTPANNTAPNITGNSATTTVNGDLVMGVAIDETFQNSANQVTAVAQAGSGWTMGQESYYNANMMDYQVQATHGAITPTMTVPQTSHDAFTVLEMSFFAGSGGSAPAAGVGTAHSQTVFAISAASTTYIVAFPVAFTGDAVLACNEAGTLGSSLTSVTDSASDTYTAVVTQTGYAQCYLASNVTANAALAVTLHFGASSGNDLIGMFDLSGLVASPKDTAATAANSSTLTGASSGATYHNISATANTAFTDGPSIVPSTAYGIVINASNQGSGPTTAFTGASTYVYATATWSSGGDDNPLTNGDAMAIEYHSALGTVNFGFTPTNTDGWQCFAVALKGTTPAAGATLHALTLLGVGE